MSEKRGEAGLFLPHCERPKLKPLAASYEDLVDQRFPKNQLSFCPPCAV